MVLIFMLLISTLIPSNSYAKQEVKLWINGEFVKTDVAPILENGRTLVPIRVISEALGYEVNWFPEKQMVSIGLPGDASGNGMFLWIGEKTVGLGEYENGNDLEVAPKLINGRTFVPIRAIAENFVETVNWDSEKWTVAIGEGYNGKYNLDNKFKNIETYTQNRLPFNIGNLQTTSEMVEYSGTYLSVLNEIFVDYLLFLERTYDFKDVKGYVAEFRNKRDSYGLAEIERRGLGGSMATIEYNGTLINYTYDELNKLSQKYQNKTIKNYWIGE